MIHKFSTGPPNDHSCKATIQLISTKLARNVHWMVLYQICVFGADLKSNMAARDHNVFSLAEILKIFLSETTKSIEL
jgi:hypothetical protein